VQHSIELEVENLSKKLLQDGYKLATAESCTGGLISAACTALAGSSDWFDCGFVTYSNDAKTAQLGVDAQLIAEHGAVSEPVARAMAFGAIRHSHAQVSIAVTGIAGPTGGSADKPVGTVWFGFSIHGTLHSEMRRFDGDRSAVREATVAYAIARLLTLLEADSHA
jgi:nicotinamide-nucleotide amidase